jgi:hypothetical protein
MLIRRAKKPMIGHSSISFLPSQWIRRPRWGWIQPEMTTASALEE